MSKPTLFLSAATIDLARWRKTLDDAFSRAGFHVIVQDRSLRSTEPGGVRKLLADSIAESDFVIHLAGMGYGADADRPFPEDPGFRCSWTQFEYYYAHKLGKEVVAFVCAPELSEPGFQEKGEETEIAQKQALQTAHRERVTRGRFEGTPLTGTVRPLNKTVADHHHLLGAVAEAVAALNRKDPAYDRVRDILGEIQASLAKLQEGQQKAQAFSKRSFAITIGAISVLAAALFVAIRLQHSDSAKVQAEIGRTAAKQTALQEKSAAEVKSTVQVEAQKTTVQIAKTVADHTDQVVDAIKVEGAATVKATDQIKEQVKRIDQKLSELPPPAPVYRLETKPSGAKLLRPVGLEAMGETPIQLGAIAPADRIVMLSREGFAPKLIALPVEATASVKVELERAVLPQEGKIYRSDLLGTEFVWVAPGPVAMGSAMEEVGGNASERPVTRVNVTHGFWMARYELTNREAALFQRDFGEAARAAPSMPAVGISWAEAVSLCEQITQFEQSAGRLPSGYHYDLPTEAEWELACRAGTRTAFYTGDDSDAVEQLGWFFENSGGRLHSVGEKQPNGLGLYDLYGNAEEWCRDWYGSYPGGSARDYSGPNAGTHRIARGGSYVGIALRDSRSAARQHHSASDHLPQVGLRLILRPPLDQN